MTWHTNTTGGPHDRPQGPEVQRSRTAADDLEDHIVREAIKSYQRDSGETYVPIDVREGAERAAQVAVEAMQSFFRECERHGGPWGGDETCPACTDEHGEPRARTEEERAVYDQNSKGLFQHNPAFIRGERFVVDDSLPPNTFKVGDRLFEMKSGIDKHEEGES